jgi:hypothetical protein
MQHTSQDLKKIIKSQDLEHQPSAINKFNWYRTTLCKTILKSVMKINMPEDYLVIKNEAKIRKHLRFSMGFPNNHESPT